jgi:hypothetical protein
LAISLWKAPDLHLSRSVEKVQRLSTGAAH